MDFYLLCLHRNSVRYNKVIVSRKSHTDNLPFTIKGSRSILINVL